MTRPITLLRSPGATAIPAAGWLASPDPLEWLREIAHSLAQGCPVAAYPVASTPADPRPAGVFLLPRSGVPAFRPRVQGLAEILPGVYVPQDAVLSAGLLPNEREFFFPYRVHFFHPTLGLTGFDAKDELSPAKLLALPAERTARWNLATPVERRDPLLKSIVVAEPPEPDELLAEAGAGIGDQSSDPSAQANPLLDKAGLIGKGLAAGTMLGAGLIFGALGKAADFLSGPGGPGQGNRGPYVPPSRNKLQEWAEKHWKQLIDKRSREIERLMKLMETNPDEGLRYALPLTGTEQSRGVAPPSWTLGAHNTRFSLGHGGGAIDGWDIQDDARLKLERQYREAARREIALGRHERAAYIFGNLLGDWTSAAKALSDAGLHRDAVSIYLHKLNNRPAAARALEDAGLLIQAAAMYAECKQFEKAGDLHDKLGNEALAREMWLAEVEAQRDPIAKARILSGKLKDHAAALALLDAAWKSGNRPAIALDAMFAIHLAAEDLPETIALLRGFFAHTAPSLPLPVKLTTGHGWCERWKEPLLGREFEDLALRHIAVELEAKSRDARMLLDFLPKLAPDDRLLLRDARRFSIKADPPKVILLGPPRGVLRPEQIIPISDTARWDSLATLPAGVSIAGYGPDLLAVAQFRDNGCHSSALRTPDDPGRTFVNHITVRSERGSSRLFHFTTHQRLHYRALDRARTAEDDAIGRLRNVLAVCPVDEGFAVLVYTETGSLSVHIYSEAAQLRRTVAIDLAPPEVANLGWRMAGSGGNLCFTAEGFLAWRFPDGQFSQMALNQAPSILELSPDGSQILVGNSGEVLLARVPKPGKPFETINLQSASGPDGALEACFLPDGSVAVVWPGGGAIYPPGNRANASATLSFSSDVGRPRDICPRGNGGFAVLTDQGKLVVFGR